MERSEALAYLKEHLDNKNLVNHSIAVEQIMIALAQHFAEDTQLWALAGLLHDIDYASTAKDPHLHSQVGADILAAKGFPDELVYAVRVHNDVHGLPRPSLLDKALFAADPLSGLIVAGALIHPDKKLAPLTPEFILKRYGEKAFARGVNREHMATCQELGLSLEEFVAIGLTAMQQVAQDIGL
ncbi:MAG: HDIG domain-containing protein [Symbiobacteriaceae bacterium]|nr:HDIG domain-containing protein [Symbiobacteriaceae bacterium]